MVETRNNYNHTKLDCILKYNISKFLYIFFKYFIAYIISDVVLVVSRYICVTIHIVIRRSVRIVVFYGIFSLIIFSILGRQKKIQRGRKDISLNFLWLWIGHLFHWRKGGCCCCCCYPPPKILAYQSIKFICLNELVGGGG